METAAPEPVVPETESDEAPRAPKRPRDDDAVLPPAKHARANFYDEETPPCRLCGKELGAEYVYCNGYKPENMFHGHAWADPLLRQAVDKIGTGLACSSASRLCRACAEDGPCPRCAKRWLAQKYQNVVSDALDRSIEDMERYQDMARASRKEMERRAALEAPSGST